MNKKDNKKTGFSGEAVAAEYLQNIGYKIIGKNVFFPIGEIDILAFYQRTIIIVEVKTVKGTNFGVPEGLVGPNKRRKLRLLASMVCQKYPEYHLRIDVIGITYNGSKYSINHIENAVN